MTVTDAPAISNDVINVPQYTRSTLAPLSARFDLARGASRNSSVGGVAPKEFTRIATFWSGVRGR